jgi:hypothetical protein
MRLRGSTQMSAGTRIGEQSPAGDDLPCIRTVRQGYLNRDQSGSSHDRSGSIRGGPR